MCVCVCVLSWHANDQWILSASLPVSAHLFNQLLRRFSFSYVKAFQPPAPHPSSSRAYLHGKFGNQMVICPVQLHAEHITKGTSPHKAQLRVVFGPAFDSLTISERGMIRGDRERGAE